MDSRQSQPNQKVIRVQGPDGRFYPFPEGTPMDVIDRAMKVIYQGPEDPTAGVPSQARMAWEIAKQKAVEPIIPAESALRSILPSSKQSPAVENLMGAGLGLSRAIEGISSPVGLGTGLAVGLLGEVGLPGMILKGGFSTGMLKDAWEQAKAAHATPEGALPREKVANYGSAALTALGALLPWHSEAKAIRANRGMTPEPMPAEAGAADIKGILSKLIGKKEAPATPAPGVRIEPPAYQSNPVSPDFGVPRVPPATRVKPKVSPKQQTAPKPVFSPPVAPPALPVSPKASVVQPAPVEAPAAPIMPRKIRYEPLADPNYLKALAQQEASAQAKAAYEAKQAAKLPPEAPPWPERPPKPPEPVGPLNLQGTAQEAGPMPVEVFKAPEKPVGSLKLKGTAEEAGPLPDLIDPLDTDWSALKASVPGIENVSAGEPTLLQFLIKKGGVDVPKSGTEAIVSKKGKNVRFVNKRGLFGADLTAMREGMTPYEFSRLFPKKGGAIKEDSLALALNEAGFNFKTDAEVYDALLDPKLRNMTRSQQFGEAPTDIDIKKWREYVDDAKAQAELDAAESRRIMDEERLGMQGDFGEPEFDPGSWKGQEGFARIKNEGDLGPVVGPDVFRIGFLDSKGNLRQIRGEHTPTLAKAMGKQPTKYKPADFAKDAKDSGLIRLRKTPRDMGVEAFGKPNPDQMQALYRLNRTLENPMAMEWEFTPEVMKPDYSNRSWGTGWMDFIRKASQMGEEGFADTKNPIMDFFKQTEEAVAKNKQDVRNEFFNKILTAQDTSPKSKRAMLGLEKPKPKKPSSTGFDFEGSLFKK